MGTGAVMMTDSTALVAAALSLRLSEAETLAEQQLIARTARDIATVYVRTEAGFRFSEFVTACGLEADGFIATRRLRSDTGKSISQLRDEGWAVAAFCPDELDGADADQVADIMTERGWVAIDTLRTVQS